MSELPYDGKIVKSETLVAEAICKERTERIEQAIENAVDLMMSKMIGFDEKLDRAFEMYTGRIDKLEDGLDNAHSEIKGVSIQVAGLEQWKVDEVLSKDVWYKKQAFIMSALVFVTGLLTFMLSNISKIKAFFK